MKIEMTPEQLQIIRTFMELQAAHSVRQVAEAKAQAAVFTGLAEKLADGSTDFDEREVRQLLTFLQNVSVLRGANPAMFTEESVMLLQELQPRIVAAKDKLDN